jgi:hypothetical protein
VSDEAEWYAQLLDLQLRANPVIWGRLRELGVNEETELRLAFIYLAPGKDEAERLAAFLRAETDYDLQTRQRRMGWFEHPEWLVLGATQPTAVSLETIDAWVEWMVAAGAAEGPCAFDGWTVEGAGDAAPD